MLPREGTTGNAGPLPPRTLGSPWACPQLVPRARWCWPSCEAESALAEPWLEAAVTASTPHLGQGERLVFAVLRGASLIWSGGRKPVTATGLRGQAREGVLVVQLTAGSWGVGNQHPSRGATYRSSAQPRAGNAPLAESINNHLCQSDLRHRPCTDFSVGSKERKRLQLPAKAADGQTPKNLTAALRSSHACGASLPRG